MKKNTLLLLLLLFTTTQIFFGCDVSEDETHEIKKSKLDELFLNGFTVSLEQVYVMGNVNSIPYLDKPLDSCFNNNNNIVTISNFTDYNNKNNVLFGLRHGESWEFSKIKNYYDTTYTERNSYTDDYSISTQIRKYNYTEITSSNDVTTREYITQIYLDNPYTYRGRDNHALAIDIVSPITNEISKTNLYLTILTNNDGGLFDGGYIYLDTNFITKIVYNITKPLTSDEVKIQIEKGNYTMFLWHNLTTFKIGNNLYVPSYNSYIYVGDANDSGVVTFLDIIDLNLE